MAGLSPAREYFRSRAIDPQVAYDVGVRPHKNGAELKFPNGRRRLLDTGRILGEKGRPLEAWWLTERNKWTTALVCEGESDSLAALTALRDAPELSGLCDLPVCCVPGTGFPVARLVETLDGYRCALLAFDPDEAGMRYTTEASAALVVAGIRPVSVGPAEDDLAGWLASVPADMRGEALASMLVDCAASAPTLAEHQALREAARLEAEAERLRAASPIRRIARNAG